MERDSARDLCPRAGTTETNLCDQSPNRAAYANDGRRKHMAINQLKLPPGFVVEEKEEGTANPEPRRLDEWTRSNAIHRVAMQQRFLEEQTRRKKPKPFYLRSRRSGR